MGERAKETRVAQAGPTEQRKRSRPAAKREATSRSPSPQVAATNGDGHVDPQALEHLLAALDAARQGDFSIRLSARRRGIVGELGAAFNELMNTNTRLAKELQRVGRVIGREGRMTERASLGPAGGAWDGMLDSINDLIDDLVRPTTEVAP